MFNFLNTSKLSLIFGEGDSDPFGRLPAGVDSITDRRLVSSALSTTLCISLYGISKALNIRRSASHIRVMTSGNPDIGNTRNIHVGIHVSSNRGTKKCKCTG